jgi:hypothetical protein
VRFPRNSIIIRRETGEQFQVHATPDMAALLIERPATDSGWSPGLIKVPCYGLQPVAIGQPMVYFSQQLVEEAFTARDGCPP